MYVEAKEIRIYYNRLKAEIDSFLNRFRKQYRVFPLRDVTRLSKIRFKPEDKVKVNGYSYNVKEAIRKTKQIYRKLKVRTKNTYYVHYLSAYKKDAKASKNSAGIKRAYNTYHKELEIEFKTLREDLWFCLNVLKELNRLSSQKTKAISKTLGAPKTESVEEVEESTIISETDFERNVSQFGNGKNLLFIAGLSGSGKSTKAAEFAKKFDAAHIELDLIEHNSILFKDKSPDKGNQIMKDWFEYKFHGPKKFDVEDGTFGKVVKDFLRYIISYSKKNKDENLVVEGIQLMYMDSEIFDMLKAYPLIITGTSISKSISQAAKREGGIIHYMKSFNSLEDIKKYIGWYNDDEKRKTKMKEYFKESEDINNG